MKKFFVVLLSFAAVFSLAAQDKSKSLNAMSLNGATGIYVVPTAHIGYDDADVGFNVGYHTNMFRPEGGSLDLNHLLQANVSFLKMFEVSGTFDIQPDPWDKDSSNDFIAGIKFQLPFVTVPVALGTNFQYRDIGAKGDHWALQFYGAISYQSDLFGWPAETTLVAGYTALEEGNKSNIDFGVGFDLIILPKYLKNFLHLLIDYANFSYSADSWGADAWGRGVFNTGIRADIAQMIPALNKFNFAVDIFIADAFDDKDRTGMGRSFGAGITFGMKL